MVVGLPGPPQGIGAGMVGVGVYNLLVLRGFGMFVKPYYYVGAVLFIAVGVAKIILSLLGILGMFLQWRILLSIVSTTRHTLGPANWTQLQPLSLLAQLAVYSLTTWLEDMFHPISVVLLFPVCIQKEALATHNLLSVDSNISYLSPPSLFSDPLPPPPFSTQYVILAGFLILPTLAAGVFGLQQWYFVVRGL